MQSAIDQMEQDEQLTHVQGLIARSALVTEPPFSEWTTKLKSGDDPLFSGAVRIIDFCEQKTLSFFFLFNFISVMIPHFYGDGWSDFVKIQTAT